MHSPLQLSHSHHNQLNRRLPVWAMHVEWMDSLNTQCLLILLARLLDMFRIRAYTLLASGQVHVPADLDGWEEIVALARTLEPAAKESLAVTLRLDALRQEGSCLRR